jgi:hypothetical protein
VAAGDLRLEGAMPVSVFLGHNGRTFIASFRRSDLAAFARINATGDPVELMVTGTLLHNGVQSLFAVGATVKVLPLGGHND